jgi:hypothetical protein
MTGRQVVCARGSMRTALWCWLTKMAAQGITCIPFIIFLLYVCPEAVPKFLLLLAFCSVPIAAIATAAMLAGTVTANTDGVCYNLFRSRRLIPWNEIEFRRSYLFSIERPYTIVRRGTKDMIRIWPSMIGYEQLKNYFAEHNIALEECSIISAQRQSFRSFDDVIGDSLGSRR